MLAVAGRQSSTHIIGSMRKLINSSIVIKKRRRSVSNCWDVSATPVTSRTISNRKEWNVACFNIGKIRAPYDDDSMKEFRLALEPINDIAKNTPGFIWMYDSNFGSSTISTSAAVKGASSPSPSPPGNQTTKQEQPELFRNDPTLMPQLSLWKDMESLRHFVTKSGHASYLRRRREWFVSLPKPYAVCWYRRADEGAISSSTFSSVPDLNEAVEMLDALKAKEEPSSWYEKGAMHWGEVDVDRYVFPFSKNYPDPPS